MDEIGFTCQFCGETQEWDGREAADAAALWHLYDEHPLRWLAVAGQAYPTDPLPRQIGRQLTRSDARSFSR